MARFTTIPNIPTGVLDDWQMDVLNSVKENLDLLVGVSGDDSLKALLRGQLGVNLAGQQNMRQVSAIGEGYTISKVSVASHEDFVRLITDVQVLANDLAETRFLLNTLIKQLKNR